jgi:transcriptional regulator of acetoin/glycerol metabolism
LWARAVPLLRRQCWPRHLPPGARPDALQPDEEGLRRAEALRKHGNNRLRAAEELGISRMGLYKNLHKYGLMSGGESAV